VLVRLSTSNRLHAVKPTWQATLFTAGAGLLAAWLLFLLLAAPVAAQDVNTRQRQETGPGSWHRSRTIPASEITPELTAEQQRRIQQLESLGYVGGAEQATTTDIVTIHHPTLACPGFNFHTTGRAAEAYLRDMEGNVLHHWSKHFRDIWPDREIDVDKHHWRRIRLFENGDILVIWEGEGIAKLDRDSNVLWASPLRAHHDLEIMPDGTIYVLTRQAHIVPRIDTEKPVLEDFITLLDADGNELRSISLYECFENSRYQKPLRSRRYKTGNIFHTNSLRVLSGSCADKLSWDRAGNILTCFRALDCIASVDLENRKLVMFKRGDFSAQHDPRLLPSGNLLMFDNNRGGRESRVLEFNPTTWREVWRYEGDEFHPFYSQHCGLANRLPNGNTLIVEFGYGRAFETTTDGTIVWEFNNPDRSGDQDQYIATLCELIRLPLDYPLDWVQTPPETAD